MTDALAADATLHDALADALARARRPGEAWNSDLEVAPVALLWPDPEGDFAPFLPALRDETDVLTLGDYDPATRTGPAYWLRYELDRLAAASPAASWDDPDADAAPAPIPVVYLPGHGLDALHDAATCPDDLRPLFALRHLGRVWSAPRGVEWTLSGLLRELGAHVERGEKHAKALQQARAALADIPVRDLREAKPLRDSWLLRLLVPDPSGAMLRWLNDETVERERLGEGGWQGLVGVANATYNVDLDRMGPAEVAARLAERQGEWASVWSRFAGHPEDWPGVVARLRQAHGLTTVQPGLLGDLAPAPARRGKAARRAPAGAFPQDDEEAEVRLRADLGRVATLPRVAEARGTIARLEEEHGPRRAWPWSRVGGAALATALLDLSTLAHWTGRPTGGATVDAIVASYVGDGWRADDALLRTLAAPGTARDAVAEAALAIYRPWVNNGATALQAAWAEAPPARPDPPVGLGAPASSCVLFADGLRYDLGQRLAGSLTAAGLTATVRPHLAALPTVTPTAKNAVAPVAPLLAGGSGYDPTVAATGQKLNVNVLRSLLADNGWQVLSGANTGTPEGGRAWTELGAVDSYGHNSGLDLARHVDGEVAKIAERVRALSAAGWRTVTVVTDHGWLLLPGGMEKRDLSIHLAQDGTRKGRCARLKPGAVWDGQTVPWHWDAGVAMAVAPDTTCFEAGHVYDHGGLSPQECVTPVVTVGAPAPAAAAPEIGKVSWSRLRCRVAVTGDAAGYQLQVRRDASDAGGALSGVKAVVPGGETSLLVDADDAAGSRVWVVLLAPDGTVAAQRSTTVGTG